MNKCDYLENKQTDWYWRGQSFTPPATHYFALLVCTKGIVARSTLYATNDTAVVSAVDGKYHLYKVTTGGTTAGSAPSYPGASNEVITDGTAVLTEQHDALDAGTAQVEPSGGSYARVGVASSLANFAGTQSAGSTTASTGTNGTTSNNGAISFPTPTANWASGGAMVWGAQTYDALTSGNPLWWWPLTIPKAINNGDSVSFAAGAQTFQEDN